MHSVGRGLSPYLVFPDRATVPMKSLHNTISGTVSGGKSYLKGLETVTAKLLRYCPPTYGTMSLRESDSHYARSTDTLLEKHKVMPPELHTMATLLTKSLNIKP